MLRLLCLVSTLLMPGLAAAATLSVSPIVVDGVGPGPHTLTVRNVSGGSVRVEARVVQMVQEAGIERLVPAPRAVVSPPVAQLRAGQDYVFRLIRLGSDPLAREEGYRIIVTEIPERVPGAPVVVALAHSVPVFIAPPGAPAGKLTWSLKLENGSGLLTATNTGGRRVRLSNIRIGDGRTTPPLQAGQTANVLGGSSLSWRRPLNGVSGSVRVRADSVEGPVDVQVSPGH